MRKWSSQAEAQEPDNPAILGNLSSLAQIKGNWAEAVDYAERAYERAEDPSRYANLLGTIYRTLGRLDDAQRVLGKAIVERPDDVNVLASLAETELARGEPSRAHALLKRALELDDQHAAALITMARLHSVTDSPEAAEEFAKKAHLVAPRNPLATLMLGGVLHQGGQLKAAGDIVERLLKVQPTLEPALQMRAQILIDQGRGDVAVANLAKRLRDSEAKTEGLLLLANAMARAGSWQELIALAERIPEQSDELGAFRVLHANALAATGRFTEAWDMLLSAEDAPKPSEDAEAIKACQIPPGSNPMGALVLARAAAEWSADGPGSLYLSARSCAGLRTA